MLTTRKLKEYLAVIVDLEKNRYILEKTIDKLDRIIQTPHTNPYKKPDRPLKPAEPKIEKPQCGCVFYALIYFLGLVYFVGFFVNPLVNFFIDCMFNKRNNTIDIMGMTMPIETGITISIGVIIGWIIIPIIIPRLIMFIIYLHNKKKYKTALKVYDKKIAEYTEELRIYNNAVNQYKSKQAKLINGIINKKNELKTLLQKTENLLTDYYALNIIQKDYRGLVPVCTIYGYLCDGRTYSLERNLHNNDPGAYNMYNDDLHHEQIISELKNINNNLRIVQNNQRQLYNLVRESTNEITYLLENVSSDIDKSNIIASAQNNLLNESNRYAALNTYQNQQRIAQNDYRNRLLSGIYYNN